MTDPKYINDYTEKTDIDDDDEVIIQEAKAGAVYGESYRVQSSNLNRVAKDSGDPIGFRDADAEVLLDFDETTRIITLDPVGSSYRVYYKGGKKIDVSLQQADTVADADGLTFFYYDDTGTWTKDSSVWEFGEDAPAALVLYDSVNNKGICWYELHGISMDADTHERLHTIDGTQVNPRDCILGSYTLQPASPTDSDFQFSFTSGTVVDEDIRRTHAAYTTTSYTVVYKDGAAGAWRISDGNTVPIIEGGSYAYWNELSGGVWQLTAATNGDYLVYWAFKTTATKTKYQQVFVPDQQKYSTLTEAQEASISNLDAETFLIVENAPLYKIIYRCGASYGTTGKVRPEEVVRLTGSKSELFGVGPANDHQELVNRDAADAHPESSIGVDNQLGSPTAALDVGDILRKTTSAQYFTGFDITENGDGSVDVDAGTVRLRSGDDPDAEFYSCGVAGQSSIALTDNDVNYIYAEYNIGSPQLNVGLDLTAINIRDSVALWAVTRIGTATHVVDLRGVTEDLPAGFAKRTTIAGLHEHAVGAELTETGTRNIAVSEGRFYIGADGQTTDAFDTSATDSFTTVYDDGASGWTRTTAQTTINNTQYDDGSGTLAAADNNKYIVHFVYIVRNTPDELFVKYGTAQYAKLADAQEAEAPTDLPPELDPHGSGILVGKVIIQKSATAFADVQSAWCNVFSVGPGSAAPGGSDGEVQYNNAGTFGADSGMSYNKAGALTLSGSVSAPTLACTNLNAYVSTLTMSATQVDVTTTSNGNINLTPNGTGKVTVGTYLDGQVGNASTYSDVYGDQGAFATGVGTDGLGYFGGTTGVPTSGKSVEVGYSLGASAGFIQAYDRDANSFIDIQFSGANVLLVTGGTVRWSADSSGNLVSSGGYLDGQVGNASNRNPVYATTGDYNADLTLADGADLVLATTAGTQIGTGATQKLGFWGATPVVQPSTTGTTAGFTAGTGTGVNDDSTFTGNTGTAAYTIGDLVLALKQAGILAS